MSGRGTMTRRRAWLRSRTVERLMPWAVIVVFFALWELCVHVFAIPRFLLPPPSTIFATLWEFRWPIAVNSWQTLMTTVIGFAFAVVFGLAGGVAIGSSRLVYNGFYPILIGFNSIPKVAVVPVLVMVMLAKTANWRSAPGPTGSAALTFDATTRPNIMDRTKDREIRRFATFRTSRPPLHEGIAAVVDLVVAPNVFKSSGRLATLLRPDGRSIALR